MSICVITCKRPDGLTRLLSALAKLSFRSASPEIEIVVVDNDASRCAEPICERFAQRLIWPLHYLSEEKRGIPFARNRALSFAAERCDFIVFIDDDEIPEPEWLEELLNVQTEYEADVVEGPVIPRFEADAPTWAPEVFPILQRPTGAFLEFVATGNLLLRSQLLREHDKLFDERFALTGGSDTHLAMRLYREGRRMVWANEALVHEFVPASRTKLSWVAKRSYRAGVTIASCEMDVGISLPRFGLRCAKAAGRIGYGLATLLTSIVGGKAALAKGLQSMCRGTGMIAGMLGRPYNEYSRIHGS